MSSPEVQDVIAAWVNLDPAQIRRDDTLERLWASSEATNYQPFMPTGQDSLAARLRNAFGVYISPSDLRYDLTVDELSMIVGSGGPGDGNPI